MSTAPAARVSALAAQRAILLIALALTTAACWLYLLASGRRMHLAGRMPSDLALAVPMWCAMMAGMMLPAAAPMFLTYAQISIRHVQRHRQRLLAFIAAYLTLWMAASVLGAWAQDGLSHAGLVSHMGASTSRPLSAGLLVVAGAYQLSPLKHACLRRCRTPLGFVLTEWRPGVSGALTMGLVHGRDCLVCCWAIMTLTFVLGTMNLAWMAALTAFMLIEKVAPAGERIARASGVWFLACGAWLLL